MYKIASNPINHIPMRPFIYVVYFSEPRAPSTEINRPPLNDLCFQNACVHYTTINEGECFLARVTSMILIGWYSGTVVVVNCKDIIVVVVIIHIPHPVIATHNDKSTIVDSLRNNVLLYISGQDIFVDYEKMYYIVHTP
jgi:hypothetical protein